MKHSIFKVICNDRLTNTGTDNLQNAIFKLLLKGDTSAITSPGQFVNIQLSGRFLRRPISVCDVEGDTLTLVYKVVGSGTEDMAKLKAGDTLDFLTGLGNGFDINLAGEQPLLVGGGVGVPPLLWLAKKLSEQGIKPTAILGFNTKDEIILEKEFAAYCEKVIVATVDGSYGIKGFVTDAMKDLKTESGDPSCSFVYTCGPEPMLKAVYQESKTSGQFSFEERMGCGFGACMGCSCKTLTGNKRICKEGPVLRKEEILWD